MAVVGLAALMLGVAVWWALTRGPVVWYRGELWLARCAPFPGESVRVCVWGADWTIRMLIDEDGDGRYDVRVTNPEGRDSLCDRRDGLGWVGVPDTECDRALEEARGGAPAPHSP